MKIFTNDEIRQIENKTLEKHGITRIDLIERVAGAVAAEVKAHCRPDGTLVVLAGWGNNGADAIETARVLAAEGYRPEVYFFNIGNRASTECAEIRDRALRTPGLTFHEITGNESFHWPDPDATTTIVDGLFGAGLNRPLPRTFQLLAHNINQSGATVISIDVPSGLFGEWNGAAARQDMLHATVTVAVEFPRLAFMLGDNADVVGQWKIARIGYDNEVVGHAPFTYVLVDRPLVSRFLTSRKPFTTKRDYGSAFIAAGSYGMMGAAVLAAQGALRSGAGKVTMYSCSEGNPILQTAIPSAMFRADKNGRHITSIPVDINHTAFGVGPGIGTDDDTANALEKFVTGVSAAGKPLVVDADALNIIARRPNILNYLPPLAILTPHAGEFDRIFGESKSDEERLKKAIKCAEDYHIIIVLKGRYTAIVRPDGKLMFNSSGTPALATPGSGDVLTGIITSLIATGMKVEYAAFVGPFIHGLAGELAEKEHGQYGVTASDIAAKVGVAIRMIMNNEN